MAEWWNLYFDVAEFLHKRRELNLNHKSCDSVDKVPSYKALDKNSPYLAWIVCPIRTESHGWARTLEISNTQADTCAVKINRWSCTITEKAPSRAFSWLKAATTAFTFKTLLRHYAKRALTPRSLNVKLGPRRNYHKRRAAIRHYANQTARPLWPLRRGPNFTLRDRGVNARLA